MAVPERITLREAKVAGESALHLALTDEAAPRVATTITHEKAVVSLDLGADGAIVGITIEW